jgi:hypothetical protein
MSSPSQSASKKLSQSTLLGFLGAVKPRAKEPLPEAKKVNRRPYAPRQKNFDRKPANRQNNINPHHKRQELKKQSPNKKPESPIVTVSEPLFTPLENLPHLTLNREAAASSQALSESLKPMGKDSTFDALCKRNDVILGLMQDQAILINQLVSCVVVNNYGVHNVLSRANELSQAVDGIRRSTEIHSGQIENLKEAKCDNNKDLENRIDRLETIQEAKQNSSKLHLVPLCNEEMDEIETGRTPLRSSVTELFRYMNVNFDYRTIHSVRCSSMMRTINGVQKFVRMIVIEFTNDKIAARLFSRIISYNTDALKNNEQPRYYAELPAGRRILHLRRLCNKLKDEGHIDKVYQNENGLSVFFMQKADDVGNERPRTFTIACEEDLLKLKSALKLSDDNSMVNIQKNFKRSRLDSSMENDDSDNLTQILKKRDSNDKDPISHVSPTMNSILSLPNGSTSTPLNLNIQ